MFLLDAGAETAMSYAGDLSSITPFSGKFTSRQRDIYSICLDSHNTSTKMLKPGIPIKEVYFELARVIIRGLKDLGLMKGNVDDAVIHGAHALFFPCGLGHMMGLDVHDMGGIEATKLIKNFLPNLPVIALTAFISSEDEQEACLCGCGEYIKKPVNRTHLLASVGDILGNKVN